MHWSTATLMFVCIATAIPLYIPAITAIVGRRELLVTIHVFSGILLPIPILIGIAGRQWGLQLRRDLQIINKWNSEDFQWFRSWGRDPLLRPGKFNAGQKANTSFVGGSIIVMLITGIIMHWFSIFPLAWRTGATFVHDLLAFAILIVIIGHIAYAIRYPTTIRAITSGKVSRDWAQEHSPSWQEHSIEDREHQ